MPDIIPLARPDITDEDVRAVTDVLRSGRLANGNEVVSFEEELAATIGRAHGVATSSGTAALHLALVGLGIGPGDDVIVPAFGFVAAANAVVYTGARPVFVDCDPGSLNLLARDVENALTAQTKAIIAIEIFGNPHGMSALAALSTKHEIPLIEDACEGLGGALHGEPVGRFGRVAVFGFYPNKQITTAEGGMIVTDDDRLAKVCAALRNHGRPVADTTESPSLGTTLDHRALGWNYRMTEMSAALGRSQLRRLSDLVAARQELAMQYTTRLAAHPDLVIPTFEEGARMSWFAFVIRLSDRFTAGDRDEIMAGIRRHDIGVAAYFPAIPLLEFYRRMLGHQRGDFPMAESVAARTIALPFFPGLTEREVDLVCQTLEVMMTRSGFARE